MPSRCVIAVKAITDLASCRQQGVFLSMQGIVSLEQNVGDLACRDIDPAFAEILQQTVLRDVVLINLLEDVLPQPSTEMGIDVVGPLADPQSSVGQSVDRASVADHLGLDRQILNVVVAVPFNDGSLGKIIEFQRDGVGDSGLQIFVAFGRSGTFFAGLPFGLTQARQLAGLDFGLRGGAFEPPDLVFEFLNFPILTGNYRHEGQDQRGLILQGHVDSGDFQGLGIVAPGG